MARRAKPPAGKPRKGEGSRVKNRAGVRDLARHLAEAQEQQAATREILRVISSSPTDLTRVMAALVESAARLCEAQNAQIFRVEPGDQMRLVARYGPVRSTLEVNQARAVTRGSVSGRCIVDRVTLHITDLLDGVAAEYPDIATAIVQQGIRTTVGVPLMRDGVPIGAITAFRTEVRPFSDSQVALLASFADQAVIAIENARLFNETKEALDRQTATSEILSAISTSPTDVQPVFDAIARHAVALCGGVGGIVVRYDGTVMRLAAYHNVSAESRERHETEYPRAPDRTVPLGAAIVDRTIVHVPNLQASTRFAGSPVQRSGRGSMIAVPLLRHGEAIGAIGITRDKSQGFSDRDIALLETFADQAVIAIENVRLFNETREALEQQTATSEILGVISRSPTDTQPVFDAIAESAARLCSANDAQVLRVEGEMLRLVAAFGTPSMLPTARRVTRGHLVGRAVVDRQTVQFRDVAQALAEYPETTAARYGVQSALAVPLLRDGVALGVIRVSRTEIQPFTDDQIALLKTFADQAVIAIENVRLFTELQEKNRALTEAHARVTESLEQQTATAEVLRVISGSPTDLQPVFDSMLHSAVRLLGGFGGAILLYDGSALHLGAVMGGRPQSGAEDWFRSIYPIPLDPETPVGSAILERRMIQLPDTEESTSQITREVARGFQFRALVTVPMLREGSAIGTISITRAAPGEFSERQVEVLQTFADQAVIAIENVRLFKELEASNREIAEKSRQLEVVSQHKSEFLANMSHELRTPLNAIIGFSEVLSEKMFGELNEKQEEYSKDIHASGQHLLSLINDILDLSKIEAGRMELELTDFHLPTALDSALTLVRERAGRRGIALQMNVDDRLGQIWADERKIRQVVLNLLSNAIKFTPEGGRIEVLAAPKDGFVEVSVTDTGVGIAPEDQEAVFEEFRQVGTAEKKVEGTGLGLTLCRKFVELHGGKIWVKSQPGAGSTFTFTIPTGT